MNTIYQNEIELGDWVVIGGITAIAEQYEATTDSYVFEAESGFLFLVGGEEFDAMAAKGVSLISEVCIDGRWVEVVLPPAPVPAHGNKTGLRGLMGQVLAFLFG